MKGWWFPAPFVLPLTIAALIVNDKALFVTALAACAIGFGWNMRGLYLLVYDGRADR